MRNLLKRFETDSFGKFGSYFFPPIAALVLLGLLMFLGLQNICRSEQNAAQSHEVVAIVRELSRNLTKAEMGQRGFLLTQQPNYLEPYHAALGSIQSDLERLHDATLGQGMEPELEELKNHIGERLLQLDASIRLQTEGKSTDATGFLSSGAAKEAMDRIREVTTRIETKLRAKIVDSASKSWTAPIRNGRGDEIGRIVLMGKFGDEFNDNDVIIASQLSFNVSVALENARLTAMAHREAERKDEFLAMLGHELRNPLAGILTGSEALLAYRQTGTPQALFESIHRQSLLMSKIVDDLLDVSRIGQGKIVLSRTQFDLAVVVEHIVSDFRRAFPERVIHLTIPQSTSSFAIDGDRTRIVQSITNLLQNACKFSDEYQPVEVNLSRRIAYPNRVRIDITDRGVGLSSKEIDMIFQMFHQSRVSIDRAQGGLGIGLTLAKGLIETHGGTIAVTSQGHGHGATFTIDLPLCDGESIKPSSPTDSISSRIVASASNDVSESCQILVIDDRMDVILPIGLLLMQDGHRVAEAYDGSSGLEKTRQFKPDIVLCDIGLPGEMNGYDVANSIRQDANLSSVYLVALSGYSQPIDQQRSLEAGFNYHVPKPIEHRVLKQLIRFRPKFSM